MYLPVESLQPISRRKTQVYLYESGEIEAGNPTSLPFSFTQPFCAGIYEV
jgi:hypothetical protein